MDRLVSGVTCRGTSVVDFAALHPIPGHVFEEAPGEKPNAFGIGVEFVRQA